MARNSHSEANNPPERSSGFDTLAAAAANTRATRLLMTHIGKPGVLRTLVYVPVHLFGSTIVSLWQNPTSRDPNQIHRIHQSR